MAKIIVDLEEYVALSKSEVKLNMLECFGVDNWSGYSEALSANEWGDPSYREVCKQIESELLEKPSKLSLTKYAHYDEWMLEDIGLEDGEVPEYWQVADFDGVVFSLVKDDDGEQLLIGDYYHDKISDKIEGFLSALNYLGIEYRVQEKVKKV